MKVNTDGVLLGAAMSIPQDATLMLDIGTGTGTIALMAAQRHPGASIHAIDIDEASAREPSQTSALPSSTATSSPIRRITTTP